MTDIDCRITKSKLEEMANTIEQLNLEVLESSAVSERVTKSYARLKAHQNALSGAVINLLNQLEEDSQEVSRDIAAIKRLLMSDINHHSAMH